MKEAVKNCKLQGGIKEKGGGRKADEEVNL